MKHIKNSIKFGLFVIVALFAVVVISNAAVILSSRPHIYSEKDFIESHSENGGSYEAIIVLGAGIRDGKPTPLLAERLDTGIALYNLGFADKVIMSGDSEDAYYDEVGAMTEYAIERGVPPEAIIKDNFGLNTHSTVYRAKNVFEVNRYLLVSQNYHLERGVFLARALGADVTGVSCDKTYFSGQLYRDLREIPARVKDFFIGILNT